MYGINVFLIRQLTENQFEGGRSYTPDQIAALTPDQFYFLLCDKKMLKGKIGERTEVFSTQSVLKLSSDTGELKGRDKDGNPIKAKVLGKSLASRLREQSELSSGTKKKRRRRRRG